MPRGRLSNELVALLSTDVISGRLKPGTLLPTEPRLCDRFNVSRTVVREAMARLARNGLISVQQGVGTIVLDPSQWNDLDPELLQIRADNGLIGDLAPDLLEIRRMIEIEVAGKAAERRTMTDVAQMRAILDRMAMDQHDPAAYTEADIAFHDALIAAAGNILLRQLMRPVNQVRTIGSLLTIRRCPEGTAESMAGHEAIFEAIARRDPEGARTAMAAHVAEFEHDLLDALVLANQGRLDDRDRARADVQLSAANG